MPELVKHEIVSLPALVAVGKPIHVQMNVVHSPNNPISAFWDKCHAEGLFKALEETPSYSPDSVGFEVNFDEATQEWDYVVGMLKEPGGIVPEGCAAYDVAPTEALVLWVKGKHVGEVAGAAHGMAYKMAADNGWRPGPWSMELYNCPRFTTPDADGNITLDVYIPIMR